ncbi:MAG: hypothetical protein HY703_12805 [Gemmatimonadetes bacterium]|nr:hypothetical protein [Gemmatimonadota bacterium]
MLAQGPRAAFAQQVSLWLDAGASHARPPADAADGRAGTHGLLGARVRVDGRASLEFSAQGGRSTDAESGSWLSGMIGGELGGRAGGLTLAAGANAFGLNYVEPFEYQAYGLELRPRLGATLGSATLSIQGNLTRGGWESATAGERAGLLGPLESGERRDGRLQVTGGAIELLAPLDRGVWLRLAGERYRAVNGPADGDYRGGSAGLTFTAGRFEGGAGIRLWRTPAGSEGGYHAGLGVSLRPDLYAYLNVGKTVTDPLYGTRGSATASFGLSWRVGRSATRSAPSVVEVGAKAGKGRRVVFRLRQHAEQVGLAGDFSDWQPRPMRRQGNEWVLELVLAPGVYHFSFVLDGQRWMVPDDAPGMVEDGWGQRNATVVVEDT